MAAAVVVVLIAVASAFFVVSLDIFVDTFTTKIRSTPVANRLSRAILKATLWPFFLVKDLLRVFPQEFAKLKKEEWDGGSDD